MLHTCFITDAVRTPIGSLGGSLAAEPATRLAGWLVHRWVEDGAIDVGSVDLVILGSALQAGQGMNPARRAAVLGGLPYGIPGYTVNAVCASGLQAVLLGAEAIQLGRARTVLAGGMENMSLAPRALLDARKPKRLGHEQLADLLILDGLWDAFYDCHMASTVESLARKLRITRRAQDEAAVRSHKRAIHARESGLLEREIAPMATSAGLIYHDERPRADTSVEALSRLESAFEEGGTITAGNASGINDGAAILKLSANRDDRRTRLGFELVAGQMVAVDPMEMGIAPVAAVLSLLKTARMSIGDVDLWEINEAFAAQIIAVQQELDIPWDRLNVNGGAIALGHPIGCSGARVLVTLLHEMKRRDAEHGMAAVCVGGGLGVAALVRQLF